MEKKILFEEMFVMLNKIANGLIISAGVFTVYAAYQVGKLVEGKKNLERWKSLQKEIEKYLDKYEIIFEEEA
ncbi:MAG: hypothetical protein IKY27_00165 [Bacteroidales bacterium]|nr:hypothetical protein [Bacteroidales bacterium]